MDIQMPRLDGFEATAAIRAIEKLSGGHIPIVAMTAHALVGDQERCLASGMDGYVSKPIRTSELFSVIGKMLEDRPEAEPKTESLEVAKPQPLSVNARSNRYAGIVEDYPIHSAAFV